MAASLCRTDTALNLSESPLHRGARQIEVGSKLGEGCIGGSRSRASDPRVHSICLQKILLQRRGAGSCLSHPGVHRTREVRSFSIHAAIQASTNLSAHPASLHLRDCRSCTESPQQVDQYIAALPNKQPLAASFATVSAELISFS